MFSSTVLHVQEVLHGRRLNLDLAKRKGWESTIVRLIDHWDLHWTLWGSLEKVVKHCRVVGATVMLEWPRFCEDWQEKKVAEFLAAMKFKFTDFDGCMYGLVAKKKGDESLPIRKPWRLAYLNSSIASYLNKMCDGFHRHVPCSGSNVLYIQGYTPLIWKVVWKSLGDSRGKRRYSESCMIIVCIAAGFSQKDSCLSLALPSVKGSLVCIAMADRSTLEETSRRLVAERERLQAIARRNEEKATERMRLKQEGASAAEQAKGAAERAAKAAGVAFPKSEDIVIKPITRPPPGVSWKEEGTSPSAIPQKAYASDKENYVSSVSFLSASACFWIGVGYSAANQIALRGTCVNVRRRPRYCCIESKRKW